MLREFAVYRPLQVARFVKTLFKGHSLLLGLDVFSSTMAKFCSLTSTIRKDSPSLKKSTK